MLNGGGKPNFSRTAAAVAILQAMGVQKGEEVEKGLAYLIKNQPVPTPPRGDLYYFYGQYYSARLMHGRGGAAWKGWYAAIRKELLGQQQPNGSWEDQIDPHYATAMACLVLLTPEGRLAVRAPELPEKRQTDEPAPPARGKGKETENDLDKLQGTWRLVTSELDGVRLGEGREEIKDTRMMIDKSSVIMTGKLIYSPNIKKEPEDCKAVGTFTIDTKKNPKVMKITWTTNPALTEEYFTQRSIYALEGENLKVCSYFPGSNTKNLIPTEFSANAGSKRSVSIWKRVSSSEKGREEKRPKERNGDARKKLEQLQGEWVAVSFEANGEAVPADKAGWHVIIKGEKVSIRFGMLRYEGVLVVSGERGNPRLDVTQTTGEGAVAGSMDTMGIYKLHKDELTVCYRFTTIGGKRPTAFETGRGSDAMMQVFKRSK